MLFENGNLKNIVSGLYIIGVRLVHFSKIAMKYSLFRFQHVTLADIQFSKIL